MRAPGPSHRVDESKDHVEFFIARRQTQRRQLQLPRHGRRARSCRPSPSCQARQTRRRQQCIKRAPQVHQHAALVIRGQQYQDIKRLYEQNMNPSQTCIKQILKNPEDQTVSLDPDFDIGENFPCFGLIMVWDISEF